MAGLRPARYLCQLRKSCKSIEELQAIASQLTVRQFEDKNKQIEAILWGREFFAGEPEAKQKSITQADTTRYLKTEKIKERWSLKQLKLLCLENGIAPTEGHKGQKETWINALFAAGVFR